MATLQKHDSIAVRMRNNKVALLVPASFGLREVASVIRTARKESVSFDVFSGFTKRKHSNARRLALVLCLVALMFAFVRVPERRSESIREVTSNCAGLPKVGVVLSKGSLDGAVAIGGVKLQVQTAKSFGGLLEIKAVRLCDKGQVKLRLWNRGADYILTDAN